MVDLQRLDHEIMDRLLRVERLVGILEDDLDPPAIVPERALAPGRADVLAVEHHPPAGLAGELDDHAAGRGLPAAQFADEAEDLTPLEREIDPVDRPDDPSGAPEEAVENAPADREMDFQAFEPEQVVGHQAAPSTAACAAGVAPRPPAAALTVATEGISTGFPSPSA